MTARAQFSCGGCGRSLGEAALPSLEGAAIPLHPDSGCSCGAGVIWVSVYFSSSGTPYRVWLYTPERRSRRQRFFAWLRRRWARRGEEPLRRTRTYKTTFVGKEKGEES
jgi:hypothetical protein